jgi:hypothetical protein
VRAPVERSRPGRRHGEVQSRDHAGSGRPSRAEQAEDTRLGEDAVARQRDRCRVASASSALCRASESMWRHSPGEGVSVLERPRRRRGLAPRLNQPQVPDPAGSRRPRRGDPSARAPPLRRDDASWCRRGASAGCRSCWPRRGWKTTLAVNSHFRARRDREVAELLGRMLRDRSSGD